MKKLAIVTALSAALLGCGGGGGGSDDSSSTGTVSLGITDAPVDDADHVVITVDKIILRRDGASDVVVDRFTIPSLNLNNAETFQIDLLDYQHGNQLLVVDDLEVPAGSYAHVILQVLDNNVNYSYVEIDGARTPIKQPSNELKLGGLNVVSDGVYTYTLDFDLRKAMTYNPGPDRYILKPRGVRIVNYALAATVSGSIDSALFDTDPQCAGKTVPTAGNVVYLYQQGVASGTLADVYDPEIATGVPADAVNPYAAVNVYQADDGSWHYYFGYIPAGQYRLAFSCNAEGDYADSYDGIAIPLPSSQEVLIAPTAGQNLVVDFPVPL